MSLVTKRLILSVLLACVGGAAVAPAEDGRDFAGFYEVTNVTDVGDEVSLTLTVRIFNPGDVALGPALLVLENPIVPSLPHGRFVAQISLQAGESVRVTGDFRVPVSEYDRWTLGGAPPLVLESDDGNGGTARRQVTVSMRPEEEE